MEIACTCGKHSVTRSTETRTLYLPLLLSSKRIYAQLVVCYKAIHVARNESEANKDGGGLGVCFIHLYDYYFFFIFLILAETEAAAPGCNGTVNAADEVGLLGFHNAVCVVRGSFLFICFS